MKTEQRWYFGVPVYLYYYRIVVNCYNFANQKKKIKNSKKVLTNDQV